ncbi:MAG: DUF2252 family protein [Rhodospirillaceae bacterium]
MNVHTDTREYESWLKTMGPIVAEDIEAKHHAMTEGLFPFLRATFYRWCRLWQRICPDLNSAPPVLAVGDLHVENFGTWRDAEGRLIWGINDVDEAEEMPFTFDLVRLATSALIALDGNQLSTAEVSEAILGGYRKGLESGGQPFVLEEDNGWLRELALGELRNPERFWEKLDSLAAVDPDAEIRTMLDTSLPEAAQLRRISHRVAGLGSLGRQRFVAVATCYGGSVAREVKALYPSAWNWACGRSLSPIRCGDLVSAAIRCPDPFLKFDLTADRLSGWVARRLAPHCCRVELSSLPHRREDRRLLRAMGRETANLHLGTPHAIAAVMTDLDTRPVHWLRDAAGAMKEATHDDWKAWRQ